MLSDNALGTDLAFSVSEFVALVNQTFEYAYPNVVITGELANFKVSKGRWVYFDLKDDEASVRFFGTVYNLPGPLEDGMMVSVRGVPRLHQQYGFSVSVQMIQPVGEGSIKKAAVLLEAKLRAGGLFDKERKRPLPYPPRRVGLIASSESAAYRDFMKIIDARWSGMEIVLIDVQVQGEASPGQVVAAIVQHNAAADPVDVLVITRGGGSPEDLAAFSNEQVTRAVAASRIPTLVAIGHEVDTSLAELAADSRASTPSNAAELLVPDRRVVLERLRSHRVQLSQRMERQLDDTRILLADRRELLRGNVLRLVNQAWETLRVRRQLLEALNPQLALNRGYALVRRGGMVIRSGSDIHPEDPVVMEFADAAVHAMVTKVIIHREEAT